LNVKFDGTVQKLDRIGKPWSVIAASSIGGGILAEIGKV